LAPRIYYPHPLKTNVLITLDESASRHLLMVLRLQIGEPLQIFNGEGGAYSATLHAVQKKLAVVALESWLDIERESPVSIHLGQAISRGERMDFTVQKSVELGVTEITPLFTERCGVQLNAERADNRVQHWRNVAISASEQCGRCRVPPVNRPQSLSDFLNQPLELGFICSPIDSAGNLPEPPATVARITLLIGPEGGFSPQEMQQARQAGFHPLSLGPRILRTETAAIVAMSLLQSRWGDLR
jgi:16S rRNA (uracil1498-N3)-methyltransferase